MAFSRKYFGTDAVTLQAKITATLAAIDAVKTRGTSVSVPDLSASFPSLEALTDDLSELNQALMFIQGNYVSRTRGRIV